MRKLFALLSLLVVASMALAACGNTTPTTAPTTPATQPPAATGFHAPDTTTLVIADESLGIDTLDPALAYDTASGGIIQSTYDTLVFYDGEATDKFVPQLAESWELSADSKTYTFKIRSGVKFHNGDVMTASDVAYSFQRGLLQGGTSSPQWLLYEPFFGVGVDDIAAVVAGKISDATAAKLDELAGAADLTKFDAAAFGTLFTDYVAAYTKSSGFAVDAAAVLADEANAKTVADMIAGLKTAADDAARLDAIKTTASDLLGAADGGDPSALYDDPDAMSKVDPAILSAVYDQTAAAIVADDAAGTVTMTLAQPWGPFLPTIAQTWGSVMDKKWVAETGGWDGAADTWVKSYAMASADDPFSTIENGTGPFKLDKFANGEEIDLVRNDEYWKEPAKLQRIIQKQVPEWGTRLSMMQTGDADIATVPAANRSQMDALAGAFAVYDPATNTYGPEQEICAYDPTALGAAKFTACAAGEKGNGGKFLVRLGRPNISMDVLLFNWNIATSDASPNPLLGSGKLDGNGIPADFFSDVHIRKAFGYCFDWDTFINDVFSGEAVQSFQLTLPGMPGFFPDTPHYTFDTAQCESEMKLADVDHDGIPAGQEAADGGDVWNMGFRVQMAYNQGNSTRQTIVEILAGNLAKVNAKFSLEELGLPWPSYLRQQRAKQLPILTGGWLEDIHDPHNWYQPYTTGTYGGRESLPADVKAQFKAILDRGVSETDPAKRAAIYKEANQLYYDLAVGIPLEVTTTHGFRQRWIKGEILNPIFPDIYYYTMYKE
jgi:peptide/nickel transport system substrate-binding protein